MSDPAEEHAEEAPTGPLTAIDPQGKEFTVPADQAGYFAKRGWKVETPEETEARALEKREGLLGGAKAFGENALSSATLGLSDVALGSALGNEYRKNRALRELAYPTNATTGEIAGMVIPALVTGGESALAEGAEGLNAAGHAAEGGSLLGKAAGTVAKAAEWSPGGVALKGGEHVAELTGHLLGHLGMTGESALGRAAIAGTKLAAAGGVEGAAFGAGSALSEAALAPDGDYDGLAQKLWAAGVHGAEFGAVTGGALGVGGSLLSSGARKLAGTFDVGRSLREFSDASALKRVGFQGSDIQKLAPARRAELAEFVREGSEVGWMDTVQDAAGKLKSAKDEAGELLGAMRKQLDAHAMPGETPNVARVLDHAEDEAARLMLDAKTAGEEKMIQKFSEQIDTLKKNVGDRPLSFEEAHQLRRTLDDEMTNYGRREYPTGGTKRPPDAFERHMMGLRNDLEHEFEASGERVMQRAGADTGGTVPGAEGALRGPGIGEDFRAAYAEAKANYGAAKELAKIATKRSGSLSGNASVGLRDAIAGAAGFAGLGPKGVLLAAASKVLRSAPAVDVAGRIAGELAALDERIGLAAKRWSTTARKGAAMAEAPPSGHSIAKRVLEKGQEFTKSTAHSGLHVHSEAAEQRERMAEYARVQSAVEREAKSAPGTLVHIPDAPKTSEAMDRARRKTANYLADMAPKPRATIVNPVIARMARQGQPSASEREKWMLRVKTAEDPMSAVDDFERGRLKRAQIETLAATAPVVLDKIRDAVMGEIMKQNSDLSWSARIQMGTLFDVQTEPSLRPEAIRAYQKTYEDQKAAEAEAQKQAAQSVPGRPARSSASRLDILEEGVAI